MQLGQMQYAQIKSTSLDVNELFCVCTLALASSCRDTFSSSGKGSKDKLVCLGACLFFFFFFPIVLVGDRISSSSRLCFAHFLRLSQL